MIVALAERRNFGEICMGLMTYLHFNSLYLNTNFININPLVSPAGGFNQRHDRMFQMDSKMGNRNLVQERFVVPASRPVLAMVPGLPQVSGPSCNEDDDLFDDDDQLMCTQVLKVCEEEERKMKRRS